MARRRHRWPLGLRGTLLIVLLVLVFAGLRLVAGVAEPPTQTSIFTPNVVVVGVEGRIEPDATDRAVIAAHAGDVQAAAISIRPRYVGACAAAGWSTLGAGRRAAVGGLCDAQVRDGRVIDWTQRLAAAAAHNGDARLGTLAASSHGCVQSVGPGAALAAARPDGTVSNYQSVTDFVGGGLKLACPITLIDAGSDSDQVVQALARRSNVTTVVTGIGPAAGSADPSLQLIYRVGTTFPGFLTSDSTRRTGIVTLTDLSATLIDFGNGNDEAVPDTVDGSVLSVDQEPVTVTAVVKQLAAVRALSNAVVTGYLLNGLIGLIVSVSVGIAVFAVRRRWPLVRVGATIATVWVVCMMLPGSVPWQRSVHPALWLTVASVVWLSALSLASLLIARVTRAPVAVTGAALTVAAFTADAALGGVMEPGSMLNSRPIYGLRWYGFGNVTFAAYASNALVLAGYLAHRFGLAGRRFAPVVAVLVVGFGVIICEGWPSMGTDFGGVIALAPPVLWLALVTSGLRVTWWRLAAIAGAAALVISGISVLDWLRGPGHRSHLGNFVQRVIDGDATDVVARKAVASVQTIVSPLGIGSIIIGAALWIGIFRFALPRISAARYSGLRNVLIAVLATAILGTVLNDGGASVWLTGTAATAVLIGALLVDEQVRELPVFAVTAVPRTGRSGSPASRRAPDPFRRRST